MLGTIIVGVLSCIGTIFGAYMANRKSTALTIYRLDQLEKKVDKHNQVIERTYNIEKNIAVINEEIKELKHD